MAGYDFLFKVPERLGAESLTWLRFVKKLAKTRHLDLSFRKTARTSGVEYYVTINGPLPEMQRLHRQLPEFALPYTLGRTGKTSDAIKTISKFIVANQSGVSRITSMVFSIAETFSLTQPNTRASELALSPKLLKRAQLIRSPQPLDRAAKVIVQIIDLWSSRLAPDEQAVISCDQAVESWMKARLGLPKSDRSGFPQVLERCVNSSLITKKDAYSLTRYHRTRNRIQHRGGRVRRETVQRMLSMVVHLLNQQ